MQLSNNTKSYGLVSILLHWLVALTIFGLFGVGFWMVDLGYYDTWYHRAPFLHKSTGIILFGVMLLRILWRLMSPPPKAPANHQTWEKRLAHGVHHLLYLMIFIILVSGYLISTADGHPIDVFGWFNVPALPVQFDNQADLSGLVHEYMAYALMGLVVLHLAGAIKHHLVDRDVTLKRMLKPGFTDSTSEKG